MKIKGSEYQYIVYPFFDEVIVEVYEVHGTTHLQKTSKRFSGWFTGITQKAFDDAKAWGEFILKGIETSNQ
jgi:hypothetical protein